jgi:hypothetical protein
MSAAKSLKATQLADQNIAAYLDATSIAGVPAFSPPRCCMPR